MVATSAAAFFEWERGKEDVLIGRATSRRFKFLGGAGSAGSYIVFQGGSDAQFFIYVKMKATLLSFYRYKDILWKFDKLGERIYAWRYACLRNSGSI